MNMPPPTLSLSRYNLDQALDEPSIDHLASPPAEQICLNLHRGS